MVQHLASQTVDREVYSDRRIVGDEETWNSIQSAGHSPFNLKRLICDTSSGIISRDRNTSTFYFERKLLDQDLLMRLAAPPGSELRQYQDDRLRGHRNVRAQAHGLSGRTWC